MNNKTPCLTPKPGVLLDYLCVGAVHARSHVCVCVCVCVSAYALNVNMGV